MTAATVLYRRPAPFNAELALQINTMMNDTNTVIPGGSPFFYMDDPTDNVFTLASISVSPTPCQMYLSPPSEPQTENLGVSTNVDFDRGLPCSIEARGTFQENLPSIELDFDIEVLLKDGQTAKMLAVKDDVCNWATVEQPGVTSSCPPQKGPAVITTSMSLGRGFIMEATYFIDLQLTSGNRKLTHVGAQITLTDPDPNPSGRHVSTS
ncbi:MAG: hypothetical protein Q9207_007636 [Kuettlingeria erythrocarpa]